MKADTQGDKQGARSIVGSSSADRRGGKDRRQSDVAPPGGRDRRRSVEPRKPEVAEIELSLSQWDALNELTPVIKRPPG